MASSRKNVVRPVATSASSLIPVVSADAGRVDGSVTGMRDWPSIRAADNGPEADDDVGTRTGTAATGAPETPLPPIAEAGSTAGSGVVGSGAVGSGVVGSGAVGSGVVGSGAVGSGVVGSGAVGSGVVGSDVVGSGVVGSDVVKRIRRKLGDDARHPTYIVTEHRVGYRMAAAEGQDPT